MSKKLVFVMVCLLIASTAFAQLQSGPSNKVGYVKVAVSSGTQAAPASTAFGLPFQFWAVNVSNVPVYGSESIKPSDVLGDQLNHGTISSADRIQKQGSPDFGYISTASVWSGALQTGNGGNGTMEPGKAYWYINKSGAARTLVLAGEVNNSGTYDTLFVNAPSVPGLANTALSWRDARIVANNNLNLVAQGFTGGTISSSDRVQEQGGTNFFYYNGSAFAGGLAAVTPGKAYWIINKHVNHTFNYIYNASGVPAPALEGQKTPMVRDVQKIAPAAKSVIRVEKSNAKSR